MRYAMSLAAAAILSVAAPAAARQTDTSRHSAMAPAIGEAAANLRQDMRKLWTDHVVWTRDYIVAAVGDQPDADAAANRLMKNQEDIGAAVAKFYGAAAGRQLTTLLKEHITIAVDLIKAAKAGDKANQQQADKRWQDNAVQIADFLSNANPNWPRATLVDMMKTHLSTTTNEVVARLNKNWDDDVRAFDAVYDHILKMSEALSDGIVKQFPDKFGTAGTSGKN
jgi:type VI protein secretion system component VasK